MRLLLLISLPIAANLCAAPALMGNTVVWKPSDAQNLFCKWYLVDLFKAAGLPDGVFNVIYGDPVEISNEIFASPDFAGLTLHWIYYCFQEFVETNWK